MCHAHTAGIVALSHFYFNQLSFSGCDVGRCIYARLFQAANDKTSQT
ncbi:hypothetical protein [Kingella negevensis]|nr:hypothetical protein [Kingella negevensis]MDK4688221.1 hypothetical protein [Kingella negevensis]MDK4692255.1 hypothetical protein [Kingella negevensis]MDK4698559.1 hypothetical protein [Kingella negevensis]